MKLKLVAVVFVLAILFVMSSLTSNAQVLDASKLWIKVYGASPAVANMSFGNRLANTTSGQDTGLSFPVEYREQEAPPPSPGFDAVWGSVRGGSQFGSGVRGLLDRQFNGFAGNAAQKDTFKIKFVQGDNADQDISFKWIDAINIALRCDSLVMVYLDPNVGSNVRLNMSSVDTLVIPAAGTNTVSQVLIIKYGCFLVDTDVKKENAAVPENFSLHQNYPNPFNPTTTIRFDILKASTADISVYNVLGQKIATLVSNQLAPGTYSTTWNGTTEGGLAVSSGMYFVRLNARVEGTGETFTALRKLLLMK